tara:strand:- start:1491 stop:2693 length:1203 start_codon:yes stop_codon:yes gene_type:complete
MLFQIIDSKHQCSSIYSNKKIISEPEYHNLSKTWGYDSVLKDHHIEYASLYTQGQNLDQCCPDILKEDWEQVKQKHFAYIKSFEEAKVKFNDYCFYDLVPESFVMEYFDIKSQITDHVLNSYVKPENYSFLLELSELIYNIEKNKLHVDLSALDGKLYESRTRKFKEKLSRIRPHISYNVFGTITGRLTTKKDSFPILTLDKNYRHTILPTNDWFIELDFNAAELRCLLALNNQSQPEEDIHQWHGRIFNHLLNCTMSREEIKRKIFGWLYGPPNASLGIPEVQRYYDKEKALQNYWDGEKIINPFGREVKADKFHALNALIQSTTSDTFLRRAIAVNKLLEGKNSFTMGLIHDSMVIDFDRKDKDILENLIKEFGNTDLGIFKVNASLGTSFGNMVKFR